VLGVISKHVSRNKGPIIFIWHGFQDTEEIISAFRFKHVFDQECVAQTTTEMMLKILQIS